MSLYTFIFFPREINEENFREQVSKNGIYYLTDLKRFPYLEHEMLNRYADILEKEMFSGAYLHRENEEYLKFTGNFQNKFCYELCGDFWRTKKDFDKFRNQLDDGAFDSDVECASIIEIITTAKIERHQLYTFIDDNINSGEFVEIYDEWLDEEWKDVWGPPLKTVQLTIEDILSVERFNLFREERTKFIVYKK